MRFFFKSLLIAILFACVITAQYYFDIGRRKTIEPQPFVWPTPVVKAADLGLDAATSDYAWLAMIQYYGGGRSDGFPKLDDYVKLANDLDPKFSYPYAFSTLIFPGEGMTEEAIQIGERGIIESDPDWRIAYYMAITYYIKLNDTKNAAKYFDIAAKTPGAPNSIQIIAANFGTRPDIRAETKQIWISLYETSRDEVVRKRALTYIEHYEVLDVLEQAAKIYKDEKGIYPADVSDMVLAGILRYIPEDPFGYKYYIDEEGRARVKN
jgi:tetratricopeptide (TPR) repeat protein